MRNKTKLIYIFQVLLFIIIAACSDNSRQVQQVSETISKENLIKKGEYLVGIMGCNDCHSPKVFGPNGPSVDPEKLLSGHPSDMPLGKIDKTDLQSWVLFNHHSTAAVGPWGVSFAGNLTPDDSGIGTWSEDQFKKAIREGKFKGLDGSRPLLPPMPWQQYSSLTDEDLKAIFTYLKSLKPVRNVVPAFIPVENING
jgi:hypothetical protein